MISQEQHAAAVEAAYREGYQDGVDCDLFDPTSDWWDSDAYRALSQPATVAADPQTIFEGGHNIPPMHKYWIECPDPNMPGNLLGKIVRAPSMLDALKWFRDFNPGLVPESIKLADERPPFPGDAPQVVARFEDEHNRLYYVTPAPAADPQVVTIPRWLAVDLSRLIDYAEGVWLNERCSPEYAALVDRLKDARSTLVPESL